MSLLRFIWEKLRGAKPEPKPAFRSIMTLAEHLADMGFTCQPCSYHGDALHLSGRCCVCNQAERALVSHIRRSNTGLVDRAENDNAEGKNPGGAA
jgi:hypothetical protein